MSKDLAGKHIERELQELHPYKKFKPTWYHWWEYFSQFKTLDKSKYIAGFDPYKKDESSKVNYTPKGKF